MVCKLIGGSKDLVNTTRVPEQVEVLTSRAFVSFGSEVVAGRKGIEDILVLRFSYVFELIDHHIATLDKPLGIMLIIRFQGLSVVVLIVSFLNELCVHLSCRVATTIAARAVDNSSPFSFGHDGKPICLPHFNLIFQCP